MRRSMLVIDLNDIGEVLRDLSQILAYPTGDLQRALKNLSELKALGVEKLVLKGRTYIGRYGVLGKGCTSIVILGVLKDGGKVALKIRRVDADRRSLRDEAEKLKMANKVGVGPKLMGYTNDLLVMEYVEGYPIIQLVKEEREIIKKVVKEVIAQCRKLDEIGLVHLELSRPKGHVIIRKGDYKPYIIDFETVSVRSSKTNVTQVISFLFFGKGFLQKRIREVFNLEESKLSLLQQALKRYKKQRDEEAYQKILQILYAQD